MKNMDQVVDLFVNSEPGTIISHNTIKIIVGLVKPSIKQFTNTANYDRANTEYHCAYNNLINGPGMVRETLLVKHRMFLKTEPKHGYYVMTNNEQVAFTVRHTNMSICNTIEQGRKALIHVNYKGLRPDRKAELEDWLAKWDRINSFL